MKVHKSVRPVLDFAEQLGFTATFTRSGHLRFTKRGRCPVFTSSTPGDRRSALNAIATLRRSDERRI